MVKDMELLRKKWYESVPVKFEIVKNLIGRETMFIGDFPIRNIKAHNLRYLESNFTRYKFMTAKMNLYNSLAKYEGLPMFSYEFHTRKQQQAEFSKTFMDYMTGYDFLFDIDCEEEPRFSYAVAYKIKEIFDKYKIRYYLLYSAGKNNGFHLRIDYEDMPKDYRAMKHLELCKLFKNFIHRVKVFHDLPFIDDTITDLRRVGKAPYSCVYPYYRICLPLTDAQFENFELDKVGVEYWLNHTEQIKNRGLLKRDGNPENFKKLVDDYIKE